MPKYPTILTKRRLVLGGLAAGIVALAIALLQPDMRQSFSGASPYGEPVDRDLDEIRTDTLRVLVIQHHLVYTRSKGAESGLEFELLESVAKELGVPIDYAQWSGLFVPAGTPEPVVARLREAAKAAASDERVGQVLGTAGSPVLYMDAPEFQRYVDADAAKMAEIVKKVGKLE